jgi:hypothetical protein
MHVDCGLDEVKVYFRIFITKIVYIRRKIIEKYKLT